MGTSHFQDCVGESLFLQLAKPKSIWVKDLKVYLHLSSPPHCFTGKNKHTNLYAAKAHYFEKHTKRGCSSKCQRGGEINK